MPISARLAAAIALPSVGAGVIHLGVAGRHLEHAWLLAGFLAIGVVQLTLGGLLGTRPSRRLVALLGLADLGIIAVWATTRIVALPWVPGLEAAQPIDVADIAATSLEAVAAGVCALALLAPTRLSASHGRHDRRSVEVVGGFVLLIMIPGLLAPHDHGHEGVHGGTLAARHSHDAASSPAQHAHPPLGWDAAHRVLDGHQHADTDLLALLPHAHGGAAPGRHPGAGHGHLAAPAPHGHGTTPSGPHDHTGAPATTRDARMVLRLGQHRVVHEPRDAAHGADFRWIDPQPDGHMHGGASCHATTTQRTAAQRLAEGTRDALKRYDNDPWRALADGFLAYPIPMTKMFHMFAARRYEDRHTLDPLHIESFMYAMTDKGLTAVGGMFIYADKEATPPNPTGCVMVWHNHTGAEGAISSFDPKNPAQSVWMAHVWTYGGLDPWGRDMDGSEANSWFFGYRYVPTACNDDGECI